MYLQAISIANRDKGGDDLSLYHSNLGVLYHRYVQHSPFTEMGRKAWLFAKLQPGRARKRINAT